MKRLFTFIHVLCFSVKASVMLRRMSLPELLHRIEKVANKRNGTEAFDENLIVKFLRKIMRQELS